METAVEAAIAKLTTHADRERFYRDAFAEWYGAAHDVDHEDEVAAARERRDEALRALQRR